MNPLSLSMLTGWVSINEARECIGEDDEQSNTAVSRRSVTKRNYTCMFILLRRWLKCNKSTLLFRTLSAWFFFSGAKGTFVNCLYTESLLQSFHIPKQFASVLWLAAPRFPIHDSSRSDGPPLSYLLLRMLSHSWTSLILDEDGLIFRMLYGLLGYYMAKRKLRSKFVLNSRHLSF